MVLAQNVRAILVTAFPTLSATARFIQAHGPGCVTFVQTGLSHGENRGDEDVACADCLEGLLLGRVVDREQATTRVRRSWVGSWFDGSNPGYPPADLELALQFDRFDFAMVVERRDGLHILHARAI